MKSQSNKMEPAAITAQHSTTGARPVIQQHTFALGVDPGLSTGFAAYNRKEKKLVEINTLSFWSLYWHVVQNYAVFDCKIYVELTKSVRVFNRHTQSANGKQAVLNKIAMNAGGVVREAELLIEGLRLAGFTVVECPATGKDWTDEFLRRVTGYDKRTSQHARDAVSLCWQR